MDADNGGACTGNAVKVDDIKGARRESICNLFIEGASIISIARAFKRSRNHITLILATAGLLDEEDGEKLTPEKTKRMCERHLKDLEREHGEKKWDR